MAILIVAAGFAAVYLAGVALAARSAGFSVAVVAVMLSIVAGVAAARELAGPASRADVYGAAIIFAAGILGAVIGSRRGRRPGGR